jgi:hypothetical protein
MQKVLRGTPTRVRERLQKDRKETGQLGNCFIFQTAAFMDCLLCLTSSDLKSCGHRIASARDE